MENKKLTEKEQEIFDQGVIAGSMSERKFWVEKFQKEIEDLKKRLAEFEWVGQKKEELPAKEEKKEVAMYYDFEKKQKLILKDIDREILHYGDQVQLEDGKIFEVIKCDEKQVARLDGCIYVNEYFVFDCKLKLVK